jgi:hypothetical protein
MDNGLGIAGIGIVKWTFMAGGTELTICTQCYYLPQTKARLISPEGINGVYARTEDTVTLSFDGQPDLVVDYDTKSHSPIGYEHNAEEESPQVNLCGTSGK